MTSNVNQECVMVRWPQRRSIRREIHGNNFPTVLDCVSMSGRMAPIDIAVIVHTSVTIPIAARTTKKKVQEKVMWVVKIIYD